jgi:uncharacterized protein DUF4232
MKSSKLLARRLVGAALIASLATVSAVVSLATSGLAASSPHARATAGCPTSALDVWLNTDGNGAAGSIYYKLELTNLSGNTCTVFGYPGVSAVNLSGGQLGAAASRDTTSTPRSVTLRSGHTAKVMLRIVEALNFPTSACHPTTAAGVRVYPPNNTSSRFVPFPFDACTTGPVYLTVSSARFDY